MKTDSSNEKSWKLTDKLISVAHLLEASVEKTARECRKMLDVAMTNDVRSWDSYVAKEQYLL